MFPHSCILLCSSKRAHSQNAGYSLLNSFVLLRNILCCCFVSNSTGRISNKLRTPKSAYTFLALAGTNDDGFDLQHIWFSLQYYCITKWKVRIHNFYRLREPRLRFYGRFNYLLVEFQHTRNDWCGTHSCSHCFYSFTGTKLLQKKDLILT